MNKNNENKKDSIMYIFLFFLIVCLGLYFTFFKKKHFQLSEPLILLEQKPLLQVERVKQVILYHVNPVECIRDYVKKNIKNYSIDEVGELIILENNNVAWTYNDGESIYNCFCFLYIK